MEFCMWVKAGIYNCSWLNKYHSSFMFFQAVNCHFQLADHYISLLHINKQTLLFWLMPKNIWGKWGTSMVVTTSKCDQMRSWKKIRLGSNRKLPGNFISKNSIGKTQSIYHIWEVKKISIRQIKITTTNVRKMAIERFYKSWDNFFGIVVELGEVRLRALGNWHLRTPWLSLGATRIT